MSGENPADWKYQGRHTHFAVGAAKKADGRFGRELLGRLDPTRFGVYLGSGEGQQDFDRFTQMMVGRPGRTTASTWPASPARGWKRSIPSPSWSRSRTCRPGTWPACSTPRGPTSTA